MASSAHRQLTQADTHCPRSPAEGPQGKPRVLPHQLKDHFVAAETTRYQRGVSQYEAEVLEFETPAQAADFQRTTLLAQCATNDITQIHTVPRLPGAAAFVQFTDGYLPYRVSLVSGTNVVHLNLCGCVHHELDVAIHWGKFIAEQLAQNDKQR